ncbi:carbohydrate ABC transporter permease [Amycolatopsis sp. PS_44_ISF1]|uniref:carbohydrate ABC transporter permease n=1 Tax=Amycolatopsis sp. PS_44_ISF1 TaxID=2974917 RepID=UPI0028DD65B7|nr:carbohydrate ABC transporter permease [Amycolatopsis sp. PS_44_ISF1]MDT8913709.1 carbohydrate ABC transporter permease [Amycolatopsis sp. PS_44_ISF1]
MTRTLTRAALVVAALSVLVPFVAIFLAALQPQTNLDPGFEWPEHPQWGNFATAWTSAGFGALLESSAIIALGVVPVAVVLATLAGYGMSMMGSRLRTPLFGLLMIGLALPLEAIVIPLYYDMRSLGLLNTYWAVILPLIGVFMPFGVFWMRSHFESLPKELTEAATVDGASHWRVLTSVLLPTARPALTTLALLYFMWAWNQFLLALILIQDPTMRTAPAGLGKFVQQFGKNIPLLCAGTLIVITPVVLLYLFFQRHFVKGILQGAVK